MKKPPIYYIFLYGAIACIAGLVLPRIFCNRHTAPETGADGSIVQTVQKLLAHDFKPADVADKPRVNMVPGIDPKVITETVYVQGTWTAPEDIAEGDTLPVIVEGVGLINGSRWLRLTIADKPVNIDVSEWFGPSPGRLERRWQAHIEVAAVCDQPELGIGVGYRLCEPLGIGISPAVTVDPDLQWAAAELRLTRRVWSGVAVGIGCGYRIGYDMGLHLSGGISVEL